MKNITIFPIGEDEFEVEVEEYVLVRGDMASWEFNKESKLPITVINLNNCVAVLIEEKE